MCLFVSFSISGCIPQPKHYVFYEPDDPPRVEIRKPVIEVQKPVEKTAIARPEIVNPTPEVIHNDPPNQTFKKQQQELIAAGYDPGKPDGYIVPQTREAIKKFQSDHNLPPTGYLDPPTAIVLDQLPTSSMLK